jgi:hypothetical protein
MITIIEGHRTKPDAKVGISLRVLDWFATKYSKKHPSLDPRDDTFDVRISYKAHLKTYRKRYFDPFRRNKKFTYIINKNNESYEIITTLGQLNFFKWVFSRNILRFVENNLAHIINDMNTSSKDDDKKKKKVVTRPISDIVDNQIIKIEFN